MPTGTHPDYLLNIQSTVGLTQKKLTSSSVLERMLKFLDDYQQYMRPLKWKMYVRPVTTATSGSS